MEKKSLFGFDPEEFDPASLNFGFDFKTIKFPGPTLSTGGSTEVLPDVALNKLKQHLQAAVSLELKTIPLYLYASYSIKQRGPAKGAILSVVRQEMLHLALAGNILSAIGGEPILYHGPIKTHHYVPKYPIKMDYQDITLDLRGATKGSMATFMELERPDPTINDNVKVTASKDIYASIGTFYRAVAYALARKDVSDKAANKSLFKARDNTQFSFGDGSWYDSQMILISDLSSAQQAIDTIVDQGEGSGLEPRPQAAQVNPGRVTDPVPPIGVKTHYEVFDELHKGPKFDHYDFVENPVTSSEDIKDEKLRKVLVACDAAYCYLLITIEKMWDSGFDRKTRPTLVTNNLQNIMLHVLTPLANFLSTQTLTIKGKDFTPAPFFNFYKFDDTKSCHQQLKERIAEAVEAFNGHEALKRVQSVIDALVAVQCRQVKRGVIN